jgi:NADPH-dependent 2,4-dienoyl-CoA reductase/sulfur reductase-like enzyme/predicted pyridoxine 5'-phosphate oxidase superfamily flavin-nucleotide-binding protein/bacterioferritin-associated ferredoxin
MAEKRNLVIIGNGMSGARTVEEILARGGAELFNIAMFGAEPTGNYNRIMLSAVLDGSQQASETVLNPFSWYEQNSIRLRAGVRATRIFRFARRVIGADGSDEPYDNLIIATGSRSFIPPLPGLTLSDGSMKPGIFGFRSLEDCLHMAEYASGKRRAAVVGGGLLGLECAHGLQSLGLEVHVIHRSPYLMNQQLDSGAAAILKSLMEAMGIRVHLGADTRAVLGDERVSGLEFKNAEAFECDLVVFATGIKPNAEIASQAGLTVERAIVVDNQMRTVDDPRIYAVGECVQHRGQTYGLVAPIWEQVKVLAEHITGANSSAAYHGSKVATRLKVAGIALTSMGLTEPAESQDEVVQFAEPRRGTYKKLIIRDGRLMGGILLGESSKAANLLHAFESSAQLPEERINLLFDIGAAPKRVTLDQIPLDAQICNCEAISKGAIVECVKSGRRTIEAVREATRAGTACGSCDSMVREIVDWACGGHSGSSSGESEEDLPGSNGEHELQARFGKSLQALAFYKHRVLEHLNPAMQEFITRQEMMFVGSADSRGNADASFRAGHANFVKVLDDRTIAYPEFRGNGVMSSMGNISENPHVGLMFIDFGKDRIGLHVNGSARIVEHAEFVQFLEDRGGAEAVLGDSTLTQLISKDAGNLERWVIVSVDEAFMHCSKHIPMMKKVDQELEWGTDDARAKGGDYFLADKASK